jgi:hypothetical protein
MSRALVLTLAALLCALPARPAAAEEDAAALIARGAKSLEHQSSELLIRLERHRHTAVTAMRFKVRTSLRDPTVAKSWLLRLEPEAVAGIQLLTLVEADGKQTIKQYVSATGVIVNIIAPPDGQTLFGSHFKLRDLKVLEDGRGTHTLIGPEAIEVAGTRYECIVIETVLDSGPYKKVVRFLDKDKLLPLRVDYFDKAGEPFKRLTVLAIAPDAPLATHTRMEMLGRDPVEFTDMFVEQYRFDLPEADLPERTFTDDYLKEVGQQYR